MNVEIVNSVFSKDIYGLSGIATAKDYAGMAMSLMDKMWKIVKSNGIKNKGLNIWVYEPDDKVFAGVELLEKPNNEYGLDHKLILLKKYAYYKHIGPYNLIKGIGQEMIGELDKKGFQTILPYIEIYGHWTEDESKLETELLMCLK